MASAVLKTTARCASRSRRPGPRPRPPSIMTTFTWRRLCSPQTCRGADHCRHIWQRRPFGHPRLLDPAPQPEAGRNRPFNDPGQALMDEICHTAVKAAKAANYTQCRHRRVPGGQGHELLFHGDQHPGPGRTYRDGNGNRHRHRPDPDQTRLRQKAALLARKKFRSAAMPLKCGSMPRTRKTISCRKAARQ